MTARPDLTNWGRWGEADERGALNYIDPEKVRGALHGVTLGRVIGLGLPIDARNSKAPAHRCQPMHYMQRDGGDYAGDARRPGGFQFAEDVVVMATHTGTHMDALSHAWTEDRLYNGFSSLSIRSTSGAKHCGIDKVGPVVTRGVLLDFVARNGGQPLDAGYQITAADVRQLLDAERLAIDTGDAVLIRTGWVTRGLDSRGYYDSEPGIGVGAAEFLIGERCSLIGCDNYAVEVQPSRVDAPFPVHVLALRQCGVHLIENLDLEELAASGARHFAFMVAPLRISGGVGSPVAPIAIV